MASKKLTLARAATLLRAADATLDAFVETAPKWTEAMGGREVLALRCEMTCIGPVPRLEAAEWEAMTREYADLHWHSPDIRNA